MTAQQDMVYGRQAGAWASKPTSDKESQKVYIPARGGPLDGIEIRCDAWDREPTPPAEFTMGDGYTYRLDVDDAGRQVYRWIEAP